MSKLVLKAAQEKKQAIVDAEEDAAPVVKTAKPKAPADKSTNPDAESKSKLLKKKKNSSTTVSTSGDKKGSDESKVIYLGHIPHGFYELEMRKFFAQFGAVKRLKLFRSQKTNRSRGYAFVEFGSPAIAEVVAQSMNGYLMSDRQLVSHVVTKEKLHDGMFRVKRPRGAAEDSASDDDSAADKSEEAEEQVGEDAADSKKSGKKKARKVKKADLTEEQKKQAETAEALKRAKAAQEKLKAQGIDYKIPYLA